jgi:hypothetical protein
MDWPSILSAGICGALAALLASLVLLGKSTNRRSLYTIVTVVLFLGLKTLSDQAILPRVRGWQADRQLRQLPFYRDIAEADPPTYEKMRAVTSNSVRNGEGADTIASKLAPIVADTLPKYVGSASDESVVEFTQVVIRELDELRSKQTDACYYFLFPHEKTAPSSLSGFNEKYKEEVLSAMGHIVSSSVHSPQSLPDVAKTDALMAPIIERLRGDYGNDLLLFQQRPSDTVARQKVCAITASLYKDVEKLPQRDASLVLRSLLSDQGSRSTAP